MELLSMFPDSTKSLELQTIQFSNICPSTAHFFREIIEDYLNLRRQGVNAIPNSKRCVVFHKIESALNHVWENLHTGQWKDVDPLWRQLYSYISLIKGYLQLFCQRKDMKESCMDAIKALDMGIIMGEPILNNLLSEIAAELNEKLWKLNAPESMHGGRLANDECKVLCDLVDADKLVETYHMPSIETFLLEIMDKKAAVITGCMDFWPAMNECRWSLEYLRKVAGYRTVPIELGSKYTDDAWSQSLTTINEFIDAYILEPNKTMGYLAQYQLFQHIPKLRQDIINPDYCYLGDSDEIQVNAWFGPRGTISPLHYDPEHNFLSQVVGAKYIRLYDEKDSDKVYPHEQELLFNTSRLDVENPDHEAFPLFSSAPFIECILEPGQILYIPPRMWHYVRSLSTSFSVSFWWK